MSRQQDFEAIYAKQHDVPAESLVRYRFKFKDGYSLPRIASHYRTYCDVMDSEEIQALRKDAERFRHLMFNHVDLARNRKDDDLVVLEFGPYPSHKLRDSIDAAMIKGDQP